MKRVAVIGAGVMGCGISAHLANCGIPSLLLDVVMPDLSRITNAKPAHLYDAADIRLITHGLLEPHLETLKECDWIIEAVLEKIEIKRQVYEKLEPRLKKGAWITSNTSGLSLKDLMAGRSEEFQKHFCITHFFNPPRYMKLVEVVTGPKTDPEMVQELMEFLEDRLGKGVVRAKDTPNFIANRIGIFHVMDTIRLAEKYNWSVSAVDKVMGPATLHPKSALFRTCDLVGLDTLALVAKTSGEAVPEVITKLIEKKCLGEKTKAGFYKAVLRQTQDDRGGKEILAFDFQTSEYRPQEKFRAESLGKAKDIEGPAERLRTVVWAEDEAGKMAREPFLNMLAYAAERIPEIADHIQEVDHAMRWGFNWELGPFEMWDALGVRRVVEELKKAAKAVPALVQKLLDSGKERFYEKPARTFLQSVHEQKRVVETNGGANLLDLQDGVFCVEFKSKMNAIDGDIIGMIHQGLDRAEKEGKGVVIANEGQNFSVGANLLLILMTAQQKDWVALDNIVREFQKCMQRIRFAKVPVVAAPHNMTLGGGCEICLSSARIVAHAETYIGLVEVGVGLIPAGGGCKNMILNWGAKLKAARRPEDRLWFSPDDSGPFPKVAQSFETIAMAKVATSAKEAFHHAYLRNSDLWHISRDTHIQAAKDEALRLAANYTPPKMETEIVLPGRGGLMSLYSAIEGFHAKGMITDHDRTIGGVLAHILSGGDRLNIHTTDEQHILDLEREAFLKLCGMEKTAERMQAMLMTGKPLRN